MTAVFRLSAVHAAMATLFPPDVAMAVEPISTGQIHPLWPEELAAMASAVPTRRAEFAAGRTAARRCLVALGQRPVGLSVGKDRAAMWPQGVFGSISHTQGLAVAAATLAGPVGVDLEVDADIEPDLWPVICTTEEFARRPKNDVGRWVRRVFAAKEAVFKAQMPDDRVMFGFDAVQITLTDQDFVARFVQNHGRFGKGAQVWGRLTCVQGLVLAAVSP